MTQYSQSRAWLTDPTWYVRSAAHFSFHLAWTYSETGADWSRTLVPGLCSQQDRDRLDQLQRLDDPFGGGFLLHEVRRPDVNLVSCPICIDFEQADGRCRSAIAPQLGLEKIMPRYGT